MVTATARRLTGTQIQDALIEAARTSEKEWAQTVYDGARWLGWRAYRVLNSKGSTPGVPDLMLLRGDRLVFAELKTETGKPTAAQTEWLNELNEVPGVETYLWRPRDWDELVEILR